MDCFGGSLAMTESVTAQKTPDIAVQRQLSIAMRRPWSVAAQKTPDIAVQKMPNATMQ